MSAIDKSIGGETHSHFDISMLKSEIPETSDVAVAMEDHTPRAVKLVSKEQLDKIKPLNEEEAKVFEEEVGSKFGDEKSASQLEVELANDIGSVASEQRS